MIWYVASACLTTVKKEQSRGLLQKAATIYETSPTTTTAITTTISTTVIATPAVTISKTKVILEQKLIVRKITTTTTSAGIGTVTSITSRVADIISHPISTTTSVTSRMSTRRSADSHLHLKMFMRLSIADRIEVFWDGENKWFRGTSIRKTELADTVQYDDGDKRREIFWDSEKKTPWRYVSDDIISKQIVTKKKDTDPIPDIVELLRKTPLTPIKKKNINWQQKDFDSRRCRA